MGLKVYSQIRWFFERRKKWRCLNSPQSLWESKFCFVISFFEKLVIFGAFVGFIWKMDFIFGFFEQNYPIHMPGIQNCAYFSNFLTKKQKYNRAVCISQRLRRIQATTYFFFAQKITEFGSGPLIKTFIEKLTDNFV